MNKLSASLMSPDSFFFYVGCPHVACETSQVPKQKVTMNPAIQA